MTALRRILFLLCCVLMLTCRLEGAVRINEFVAFTSDRLLRWDAQGRASIGSGVHWSEKDFDDGNWSSGTGGFGYPGQPVDLEDAMAGSAVSVYLRCTFGVYTDEAAVPDALLLDIDYDDDFVAYVNGREIARKNCGAPGAFVYHDQPAFSSYSSASAERIDLGAASGWLTEGDNVLAIQVHNRSLTDSDLKCVATLLIDGGRVLADDADVWRYQVGTSEPSGGVVDPELLSSDGPAVAWGGIDFDDADWLTGAGGIGYGDGDDQTDVEDLVRDKALSVYMRQAFIVAGDVAGRDDYLELTVDYDDGFVAYLNGYEVARRQLGSVGDFTPFDSEASNHEAGTPETILLLPARELLLAGTNVLAIQVHNSDAGSSDMSMIADLNVLGTPSVVLVDHADPWRYVIGTAEPADRVESVQNDDVDSNFLDWIEIHNDAATNVSLAGWSLTDRDDDLRKWRFPDMTLRAGEHLVVFCSGRDLCDVPGRRLHTSFELDRGGEYLGLVNAAGDVVSELDPEYPRQDCFSSYGWDASVAAYRYFATATPGGANAADSFVHLPSQPVFSRVSGFHARAFAFTLTASPTNAVIYYTTDGSTPSPSNGQPYTGSIFVSSTSVFTARAFNPEGIGSRSASASYFFSVPSALRSLPILSLIGDDETALFKPHGVTAIVGGAWNGGVWESTGPDDYNMIIDRGRYYERSVSMQIINPTTGAVAGGECGIRGAGSNYMRPRYVLQDLSGLWLSTGQNKPMFNVYYRNVYGADRLDGFLIPDVPVPDPRTLRLRAGHNDSNNPFLRDELARRLLHDMGGVCAVGFMASLYVNGEFKGYYNPCERYATEFFQRRYDSDREWDVMTHGTGGYRLNEGTSDAWLAMFDFISAYDTADPANYRRLTQMADLSEFIDYCLVNIYAGTWDWGGNNWTAARERSTQGRFRYYVWDAEGAFGTYGRFDPETRNCLTEELLNKSTYMSRLFTAAYRSDQFKVLFYDRVWQHFFTDGGALTDENIQGRFDSLASELDPVMQYVRGVPVTRSGIQNWINLRRPVVLEQLRAAGLHSDVTPPVFSVPDGAATNGTLVTLSHSNAGGAVYYAFDGADPYVAGGAASGTLYVEPISIDRSRQIRARVLVGGEWSAAADVTVTADLPPLVVSEIMYNPGDPGTNSAYGNDDFEFVEIYNAGTSPLHLSGYCFVNGISFDFGLGDVEVLPAGGYAVVVRNRLAFAERYDVADILVAGEYDGKLANDGEALELAHAGFGQISKFSYGDGWYDHTDGEGFSLVLRRPSQSGPPGDAMSWKPSSRDGGSPGRADDGSVPEPGTVVISEVLTHTDASPVGDWIELHNRSDETVTLAGWTLSDDGGDLLKYSIPTRTFLAPHGYMLFNASNHFAKAGSPKPFAISEHGDEVILTSGLDGFGVMTGYRHRIDVEGAEREMTFGLHERRDGVLDLATLEHASAGQANADPLVGPVVISEIMYHPATQVLEFIELYNCSGDDVALYDPSNPANTWTLGKGVTYAFPSGVVLPAYTSLVVCATSPAAFRVSMGLLGGAMVFGPWDGALNNDGDEVRLYRPGVPDEQGVPRILVDRVDFNDKAPWPEGADTETVSMQRVRMVDYGNEPFNWTAGVLDGSPGADVNVDSDTDGIPDLWEALHGLDATSSADAVGDVDGDGQSALAEYLAGTHPGSLTNVFQLLCGPPGHSDCVGFRALRPSGVGYTQRARFYAIDRCDDLRGSPFTPVPGWEMIPAEDQWVIFTNALSGDGRYYRGRVWLEDR